MKNSILNLGVALSKTEQSTVKGGNYGPCFCRRRKRWIQVPCDTKCKKNGHDPISVGF